MTDLDRKVSTVDDGTKDQSHGQSGDSSSLKYLWKIPVDLAYIKSLCGILEVAIVGFSMVAWISCSTGRTAGCDYLHGSTYSFFDFIAGSSCLTFILWWLFYVVTLNQRLRLTQWRLGEMIVLGVFGIMYAAGSIAIAINDCYKASNKVAAAFGFFSVFAMGAHFYLSFRIWRETESSSAQRSQNQSNVDDGQRY